MSDATIGISRRATTSSRHPGRVFEGTVKYRIGHVVKCESCGNYRRAGFGAHGVLWAVRDGVRVLVDCIGRVQS